MDTITLKAFEDRFGIPGKVTFAAGGGGLPRVDVKTDQASASVYLHGAHVTHYQPAGAEPVLFLSEKSMYEAGKPIRGGVPICFPWFGPGVDGSRSPIHGVARLREWTLRAIEEDEDGRIIVELALQDDEASRAVWPHAFELVHRVTVGHTLTLGLEMHNTGQSPCTYEDALHTYFAVGDVRQVTVSGLHERAYLDKTAGGDQVQQQVQVTFTGETDRVYDSNDLTLIDDPAGDRRILVSKEGSNTTVVWNPWIDKAKAMADFGDDEWTRMVCVETANAREHAVTLQPGQKHTTRVTLALSPRPRN